MFIGIIFPRSYKELFDQFKYLIEENKTDELIEVLHNLHIRYNPDHECYIISATEVSLMGLIVYIGDFYHDTWVENITEDPGKLAFAKECSVEISAYFKLRCLL